MKLAGTATSSSQKIVMTEIWLTGMDVIPYVMRRQGIRVTENHHSAAPPVEMDG